jgi:hypothetical protein
MTIPAKRRAEAQRLARAGHCQAEIARRLGISRRSVQRIVADVLPDSAAAAPEPTPAADAPTNARELTRAIAEQSFEIAKAAAADGHTVAAVRAAKAAREATADLLRDERARQVPDGAHVFTTEQLKAARAQLVEMVDRLAASPEGSLGVCSRCGADLRMARASAPDPVPS